jgi:hypothetical protein
MLWVTRRWVTGALAALAMLVPLLIAPSAEAGDPTVTLKISKHRDGPFVHDLSESGNPPSLAEGEHKNFYLRAKNKVANALDPNLINGFVSNDYTARYFRKDNEITDALFTSGYDFHLGVGKTKSFRLRIKRKSGSANDGCVVTDVLTDVQQDFALVGFNVQSACD